MIFTVLHTMQMRSSDEKAVSPSVCQNLNNKLR